MSQKSPKNADQKEPKSTDPYVLDNLDNAIIRHLIEYPGSMKKELMAKFDISYKHLRIRMRKPAFKKAIEEINMSALKVLERNNGLAARRLGKLINHEDPWVALKAIELTLRPLLNKGSLEIKQVQEIIYRARFGENGEIISDRQEIESTMPQNTLELLQGGKK